MFMPFRRYLKPQVATGLTNPYVEPNLGGVVTDGLKLIMKSPVKSA